MISKREVDSQIEQWLAEGPDRLPDAVIDRLADEVQRGRGRASRWWAGPAAIRAALVAGALLAAAGIGLQLLAGGGVGQTRPAQTPRALPVGAVQQPLEPGAYVLSEPFPVDITMTVPEGWAAHTVDDSVAGLCTGGDCDAGLAFWIVDNLPIDGCRPDLGELDPPVGPTVDDLATALIRQPGYDSIGPREEELGGRTGRYVELTGQGIPDGGCSLRTTWTVDGVSRVSAHREHDRIWIIDVGGVRLVVTAFTIRDASQQEREQLLAMVESIHILGP